MVKHGSINQNGKVRRGTPFVPKTSVKKAYGVRFCNRKKANRYNSFATSRKFIRPNFQGY